jgi:hypothetical protein
MAPVSDDAEAYGHSLREEEKNENENDDAIEDDLYDLEKDLEALE